jgi:hypothetical protein
MCIACEMGFWDMVEALPPETRERILRAEAARLNAPFACDEPEATPAPDERLSDSGLP